ncbi:MAG TPA: polysaccharide biosynthesis/export family protein [Phycisphaerae bacterium]|nr:polysaccharide biosynthesis/export family protein [Phycisphaerae bacterium]HNU43688.1 polysaccharide biosynthesis/export family protein [Phycisphaerae bacterium]
MTIPRRALVGITAAVLGLAGCASKNEDILQFLREHEHEVSAIEYRVGVPDSVEVSAPRAREIDGVTQRIQPDGKITLRLLGDVKVVGMTAKEMAAKLQVLLSRYYVDPKVSVRVVEYASKKYYVAGVPDSPGPKAYTGRDTLMDAALRAGLNFKCWTSQTKVIRPGPTPEDVTTIRVDVDRMIKTGDWSGNILLEPNDVVYIPPTPLAWAGLRLRELLFPFTPVQNVYQGPAELMRTQDKYDNRDGD